MKTNKKAKSGKSINGKKLELTHGECVMRVYITGARAVGKTFLSRKIADLIHKEMQIGVRIVECDYGHVETLVEPDQGPCVTRESIGKLFVEIRVSERLKSEVPLP